MSSTVIDITDQQLQAEPVVRRSSVFSVGKGIEPTSVTAKGKAFPGPAYHDGLTLKEAVCTVPLQLCVGGYVETNFSAGAFLHYAPL